MKKITTCLSIIILLSILFYSFSKDKKEKEKKLSKKEMEAQIVSLDSIINVLKQQIATRDSALTAMKAKTDELTQQNGDAVAALNSAKSENDNLKKVAEEKATHDLPRTGLTFKVQVGAYKKFNISANFEKPKVMDSEDIDGYNKYLVGYFEDQEKAEAFNVDMKKMGIKDSWVVPYKNGKRISDEEASEILGHPLRAK